MNTQKTKDTFEIEKLTSGSIRWWVVRLSDTWPNRTNVRGSKTKKEAKLIIRMLEGDRGAVKEWYRLNVKQGLKEFGNEKDAWRSAVLGAVSFGLNPDQVCADPDTGEPKDE